MAELNAGGVQMQAVHLEQHRLLDIQLCRTALGMPSDSQSWVGTHMIYTKVECIKQDKAKPNCQTIKFVNCYFASAFWLNTAWDAQVHKTLA